MRFLSTNSDLEKVLARLLKRCSSVRWAVAWASTNAPNFKLLSNEKSKIAQLTVGIHFYQTDPEFIATFIEHPNARFILNPSGVFHPKLYYFEHENGNWDCIIGSPNFTKAAFKMNSESAVWINQDEVGAEEVHEDIVATLDRYQALGKSIGSDDLEAYRAIWARQRKRLGSLSGTYSAPTRSNKLPRSPLDTTLLKQSWRQYFRSVKDDTEHTAEGRLAVLEEAARLFRKHKRFSDIDEVGRRGVAGFPREGEKSIYDWEWFGSMYGPGYYKQAVNENNSQLSDALDHIPLTGIVHQSHFDSFLELFLPAFKHSGIATATRLLAFKRPDYFVCLDSKNRKQLCNAFDIPQNIVVDDYWTRIVERILDSNWWNTPEPEGGLERRIWRCRAAFLDVLFYDPD